MTIKKITFNAAVLMIIIDFGIINESRCSASASDYEKISKCCPPGNELIVLSNIAAKSEFKCRLTSEEINRKFFGQNLKISNDSQFPDCDIELSNFDAGGFISRNGCIDIHKGQLHALNCPHKFPVEVHKLFKCCAQGKKNSSPESCSML